MTQPKVRTRFAPSPTGYLHVGGARTALYSYLFAKHHGGEFVLRIEDTDEERSTEDALHMQIGDLLWLGLNWDEGPEPKTLKDIGKFGPYRQSQRKPIYKEYADKLLYSGQAYFCFLTDEEIELQRKEAMRQGRPPQVNSPYRNWDIKDAQKKLNEGQKAVVRFKVQGEKRDYKFTDLVRGEVNFPSDMVGDFVMLRSSGMPVYNFCCVIDDALMNITHVLRAEEHLSNTLRQLMLYEALKFKIPEFGHLSIILGSDRQKLSKRHGATSCHEYMQNGYLAEAMNNFIALLGWSSPKGQEILSRQELIEQFGTDRLHSAAAVFDETKLKWVNATHLRAMPHEELWQCLKPHFQQAGIILPEDKKWQDQALSVFKTSMETLKDAVELFRPLSLGVIELTEEGRETMSWETSKVVVQKWRDLVANHGQRTFTEVEFNNLQEGVKNACNVKGKHLFMPIRVAIIGKPHGAELKMLVPLLNKEILVQRAEHVLAQI